MIKKFGAPSSILFIKSGCLKKFRRLYTRVSFFRAPPFFMFKKVCFRKKFWHAFDAFGKPKIHPNNYTLAFFDHFSRKIYCLTFLLNFLLNFLFSKIAKIRKNTQKWNNYTF